MLRQAAAPLVLAFAIVLAGGNHAAPTVRAQASRPSIDLQLSSRAESYRMRIEATVQEASARYTEWLGPSPEAGVVIRDGAAAVDRQGEVVIPAGVWDPPGLMRVESHVAYGLARHWLAKAPAADSLVLGIAWYLQSRIVERLFDYAYLQSGYRHTGVAFFNCHVTWAIPSLRMGRFSEGLGRDRFLRHHSMRTWPGLPCSQPANVDEGTIRAGLALASLEREVGWPTLQGALRVVATSTTTGPVAETIGRAIGRDLSTFFAVAMAPAISDYRIAAFTSEASASCGSPCYLTRVTLAHEGAVALALPLRLEFSDGQTVTAQWQGQSDLFEFESTSPAVSATLDPQQVWLLDADPDNGRRVAPKATNVPVGKWLARWAVWLQHAMLTYTFPL